MLSLNSGTSLMLENDTDVMGPSKRDKKENSVNLIGTGENSSLDASTQ
jgi:hypothetical protein